MEKNEIDLKLAQIGKDRYWLAEQTGYTYTSLRNLLAPKAKDLSFTMQTKITQAFEQYETAHIPAQTTITCHPTDKERQAWASAGIIDEDKFNDFAISRINKLAESINSIEELKITTMPKKKANIMAAAGSGIQAEVVDWEGDNDTVEVGIYGLSMLGTFDDGDVITMRHKKASRSPYMKKGLIYLIEYDGGYMTKEYNTRKPTADEKGADYIDRGVVKILKSHNPDKSQFPDIIITQEVEWFAWYEGE